MHEKIYYELDYLKISSCFLFLMNEKASESENLWWLANFCQLLFRFWVCICSSRQKQKAAEIIIFLNTLVIIILYMWQCQAPLSDFYIEVFTQTMRIKTLGFMCALKESASGRINDVHGVFFKSLILFFIVLCSSA